MRRTSSPDFAKTLKSRQTTLSRLNLGAAVKVLSENKAQKGFYAVENESVQLVKLTHEENPEFFLIDHMSPVDSHHSEKIYHAYCVNPETGFISLDTVYHVKKIPPGKDQKSEIEDECSLHGKCYSFRLVNFDAYPIDPPKEQGAGSLRQNASCYLVFNEVNLSAHKRNLFETNFKAAIDKMANNSVKFYRKLSIELVKIHDQFFLIDFASPIGSGGYATVYEAYLIDESTGRLGNKVFVAKVMRRSDIDEVVNEQAARFGDSEVYTAKMSGYLFPKLTGSSRETIGWIKTDCHILLTEYMAGSGLYHNKEVLHSLHSLDIDSRLDIIDKLFAAVIRLQTPNRNRPAFVHGDLTGFNIVIQMALGNSNVCNDVSLIDTGKARALPKGENTVVLPSPVSLTEGAPPEPFGEPPIFDVRSDTYSLVPIIGVLLNCSKPFLDKFREDQKAQLSGDTEMVKLFRRVANVPFNVEDVLQDFGLPLCFRTLLVRYFDRMQELDYTKRVYISQAREFFAKFRMMCRLESYQRDKELHQEMAQLILEAYEVDLPEEQKTPDFYQKLSQYFYENYNSFSAKSVTAVLERQEGVSTSMSIDLGGSFMEDFFPAPPPRPVLGRVRPIAPESKSSLFQQQEKGVPDEGKSPPSKTWQSFQ